MRQTSHVLGCLVFWKEAVYVFGIQRVATILHVGLLLLFLKEIKKIYSSVTKSARRVLFLLPKLPLYSCWVVLHSCCVVLYSCCTRIVSYRTRVVLCCTRVTSCYVVLYSCCLMLSRVVIVLRRVVSCCTRVVSCCLVLLCV